MKDKGVLRRLTNELAEKFSSTWRLLSETTVFLSRTKLFPRYENMLRQWRHRLESSKSNPEVLQEVRDGVITLRKELRRAGYDLTLGSKDIKIEGYRNDAAVREGFTRMVMVITDTALYYIAGQENHVQLMDYLDNQLRRMRVINIRQRHYLWYRWRANVLVLSGSDTEMKDDFEELKQYVETNKLFMLKQLKKL
ncbi:hypothetical protein [Sediminispirochaeta smaragdinae]|jgi:hypothetical protein|uniref:Uncharacterized protein n=1 Tax=Sediminispirochaeta smaragdinae (strain DSM 11293 / JCM 15392 / SEBR 4228) TaxID=573413 RepID=E1RBA7_SEDSS|nr:hypothetical protein [Sediminispirochaeta smaragdinae]ADK79637.1 hypothetical protein Spirs_0490 [Sediminispirochaeta smaragdinae DSM 11293]